MPRVSALRSEPLRLLARQFRFASRRNALAALDTLDTLAERIDPSRAHSSRWLVHELTGYTPEDANEEALFPGEALVAELSALAEHICAEIALREDEVPGALTVDDLAARWSVTRRTIERRRREGLVARRVGEGTGARLVFTLASVESFERRTGSRAAQAFSRTTAQERADVVRRARRYRERLGWPLSRVAERVALRTGRSVDTVRRVLLAHDRTSGAPIFPPRRTLDERERDAILSAVRRGLPLADLAAAKGRSRESIARIANERLLARLRGFDLRGPVSPMFERDDAADVLLAPAVVRDGLLPEPALDAASFVKEARAQTSIDPREEAALAVALAFLRWRAAGALARLAPNAPPAGDLDQAETDLRWASRLAVKLARTQRRVAIAAIEERAGDLLALRDEHARALHLAVMRALCDAALRFDPFAPSPMRPRLAARSTVALAQALSAALASPDLRGAARPSEPTPARARRMTLRPIPLLDWTRDATPWTRFIEVDPRVRTNLAPLDEPARRLLTLRYGLDGAPPLTRARASALLGMSLLAAGALERTALRVALGLAPTPKLRPRYASSR